MFRLFCFDVRDLFYTFSIRKAPFRRGGGGPYPLQESPWSATSFSYQCSLRVFPRVQSRMHIQYGNPPWGCNVLYIAQVPSRLTVHLFPCVGFSKDTHPNDWPVQRSKWLRNFNSSRKIEASAAFRKLFFFCFFFFLQFTSRFAYPHLLTMFQKIVEKP